MRKEWKIFIQKRFAVLLPINTMLCFTFVYACTRNLMLSSVLGLAVGYFGLILAAMNWDVQ